MGPLDRPRNVPELVEQEDVEAVPAMGLMPRESDAIRAGSACGCPRQINPMGNVALAHSFECHENPLKVGSRFYHRRADLFGTIREPADDQVVVQYEPPHDGRPATVPFAELVPASEGPEGR